MDERMKKCLEKEDCWIPRECYQYYISYTEEEKPRLQSKIDWNCFDRMKRESSTKEDSKKKTETSQNQDGPWKWRPSG